MSSLAIVIPAYKNKYFDQALLSIANQTNKDFTLYIGVDGSPENLYAIVEKYESSIPIVFTHFDENLGGENLVAQWERCIDLVGDEEWIWLFSDDDIMGNTCVENFYQTLKCYPDYDMYHFNVTKIDGSDNEVMNFFEFPDNLTSEEFLIDKLQIGYFSTVVEYVFRKEHFYSQQRFQNFDLAWCSDDATWIKLARSRGIRNIDNSKVYWRTSHYNISANNWDLEIVKRKFYSRIRFAEWIFMDTKVGNLQMEISHIRKLIINWFIRSIKCNIECLSFKLFTRLILDLYFVLGIEESSSTPKVIYLSFYKVYRFNVRLCKKIIPF